MSLGKITAKSHEEMIEVVASLVKKGLTFEVYSRDGDWIIELLGGF